MYTGVDIFSFGRMNSEEFDLCGYKMSQIRDQLIQTIASPTTQRLEEDVDLAAAWLKRQCQILRNMTKADLREIVRSCGYKFADPDDVVVQQGEEGDRMYLVLRGSCTVYIDASMTGEEDVYVTTPVPSPSKEPGSSPDGRPRFKALERSKYGKLIVRYDVGDCFGEAALLDEDKTRNATVVADEECDFLVIDQNLFDQRLRGPQQQEHEEICQFVESHPYFRHMSPKFKRLLELSLRKETYPYDAVITQQGTKVTALVFILKGLANVYMESEAYQKQYPHLWPFEAGSDLFSQEFEWLRESRRNQILRKYEDPAVRPTKSDYLVMKRTEGYAAVEKRLHERISCLCSVHDGEVLGDLEVVMKLQTHMFTVTTTAHTTALVLDLKNLERVVGRRNPVTMEVMKQKAKERLKMRIDNSVGKDLTFLNFLLDKSNEERLPSAKKLPPIKPTKQLPPKDIQVQHLLEKFKSGEAQLLEPRVPGALIYKDQMKEKARIRANIRNRGSLGVSAMLRETRRKMNRRQPRSRREIVESLKEMMEAELVEYSEPKTSVNGPRIVNEMKKESPRKQPPLTTPTNPSTATTTQQEELKQTNLNQEKNENPDTFKSKKSSKNVSFSNEGKSKKTPRTKQSPTERITPKEPSSDKLQNTLALPAILETRENSGLGSVSTPGKDKREEVSGLPVVAVTTADTQGASSEEDRASKLEYHRTEVAASRDSPTKLPPLAKPELRKPQNVSPRNWDTALKFVSERVNHQFNDQLLSDSQGGVDDYETSDVSLALLENRIKTFFVTQIDPCTGGKDFGRRSRDRASMSQNDMKLPPLKRFLVDLEDSEVALPKPGGKVWIRKRLCRFANSNVKVKDHSHIRYHMVDELPQFADVHKAKVVMKQFMTSLTGDAPSKTTSPRNSISDARSFT